MRQEKGPRRKARAFFDFTIAQKNRRHWTLPRAAGNTLPANLRLNQTELPAAAIAATPAASAVVEREADRPRRATVSRTAIVPRSRVAPRPHRRAIPRCRESRTAVGPRAAVRVRIAASPRAAPSAGLGRGRADRANRQRGDGSQHHDSQTSVHVSILLQTTESSPTWPFTALWAANPQAIPAIRGQTFRHRGGWMVSDAGNVVTALLGENPPADDGQPQNDAIDREWSERPRLQVLHESCDDHPCHDK